MTNRAITYARAVVNKKIEAPKYIIKQCADFLNIADGKNEKYVISKKKTKQIEQILKLLNMPKGLKSGQNLYECSTSYQWLLYISALAVVYRENPEKRRYETVILEIGRKNFKTYTVGTLFIILFLTEPQFSKFFSVAPDGSLSREVREAIAETLKASPLIYEHNGNKRFKILRDYISCTLNSNKYIPLNYSTSRLDGRLPQVFVADEVGALPNSYAIDAMRSGQLNILNKLGCIISTKYPTIDNPFETEVDYAKKVLDGIVKDETIFALLYEPDDTINWATNDLVLKHANPAALENPVIWEDLLKKRAYAIAVPSARSNFCCKHCNISMQDEAEAYIEVSAVQKCRRAEPIDWTGRDVWLAMDLAVTTDNCAVAMVSEENGEILAETWAFIPEGRIEEKNTLEKINYNEFIRNGKCFACGDRTVDYKFIEDFIIGIEEKYGVVIQSIGYDRYNALSSAQKLDEAGYNVVEIKQHSSVLHPATKLLKEKIFEGEFEYSNNPLLEINFQNARCLYDTNLNAYVAKKRSAGKVDEVVALINAVCLLQRDVVFGESTAPIQII
mgnify:FL=1